MARGLPDDANVKGYGDIHRSDDITELAARLGSPLTYKRQGNVLYTDAFERGVGGWVITRDTVAEDATLSGSYNIVGGVGLVLANATGDQEIVKAERIMPMFSAGIYAVFVTVSLSTDAWAFQLTARHYDGSRKWDYMLDASASGETMTYGSNGGSTVTLTDQLDFFSGEENFHVIGLFFDTKKNEYVQVTVDGTVYDLAGVVPNSGASDTAPQLDLWIHIESTTEVDATAIIDSVVLVQNPTTVN